MDELGKKFDHIPSFVWWFFIPAILSRIFLSEMIALVIAILPTVVVISLLLLGKPYEVFDPVIVKSSFLSIVPYLLCGVFNIYLTLSIICCYFVAIFLICL